MEELGLTPYPALDKGPETTVMAQSTFEPVQRHSRVGGSTGRGSRFPGVFRRLTTCMCAVMLCAWTVACGVGDDRVDRRGPIEFFVDGEPYGIHADRFQAEHAEDHAMAFHMHEDSENWYMEGQAPVTVAEGLDLLPHVAFQPEGPVLTIDGVSYDASEPEVVIQVIVDGEAVDSTEHVLDDGQHLRVEIRTH